MRSAEYVANELNQYTQIDTASFAFSASPCETFNPEFDVDGNQTLVRTATGVWRVTYNGENRPVFWENIADESDNMSSVALAEEDHPITNQTSLSMSYDRMGRRVRKNNLHFVYFGYLCVKSVEGFSEVSQSTLSDFDFIWDPTEAEATHQLVWRNGLQIAHYVHESCKNVADVVLNPCGDICKSHYEYSPFGDI